MKYEQQNYAVRIFKILSNANRLKIIDFLEQNAEPVMVNDIAEALELEPNNVSNHVVRLREGGILKAKQSGNIMLYSVRDKNILEFIKLAKKFA